MILVSLKPTGRLLVPEDDSWFNVKEGLLEVFKTRPSSGLRRCLNPSSLFKPKKLLFGMNDLIIPDPSP